MSRRKLLLISALALAVSLLAACAGGTKAPSRVTPPPAATAAANSEVPPPAGTSTGALTVTDIHAADAVALPEGEDGRSWWPVAARGDELLLDAERAVPPAPGEPIGRQAPDSYDEHFVWWNPSTGQFTDAWQNESAERQGILAYDATRAVIVSSHMNGLNWTLSVRHFDTGVVDIVARSNSFDDVIRSAWISANRLLIERSTLVAGRSTDDIDLFDLTTGSRSIVAGPVTWTAAPSVDFSPLFSASMLGERVAWVEQAAPNAARKLVVFNLDAGTRATVPTLWPPASCYLFDEARQVVCEEFRMAWLPRRKAITDLRTGQSHEFTDDATTLLPPSGRYVSWTVYGRDSGEVTSRAGYYDPSTDTRHMVDNDLSRGAQLLGNWFTWTQDDPNRNTDTPPNVGRTLYVMRLP